MHPVRAQLASTVKLAYDAGDFQLAGWAYSTIVVRELIDVAALAEAAGTPALADLASRIMTVAVRVDDGEAPIEDLLRLCLWPTELWREAER